MPSAAAFLKAVRQTHLYVGVFAAPAILFFAFTGAVQTFSLHESTKGSTYVPPRILVVLAQIHKKQTPITPGPKPFAVAPPKVEKHADHPDDAKPEKKADAPVTVSPTGAQPSAPSKQHNPWPLKIFFLLIAISLFTSTLTGIYMSYKYTRNRIAITILLILGIVIPVLFVVV
jgi:hypothetical protein